MHKDSDLFSFVFCLVALIFTYRYAFYCREHANACQREMMAKSVLTRMPSCDIRQGDGALKM